MPCRQPESYFIARDEWHLQALLEGTHGRHHWVCHDHSHQHYILRAWALERDVVDSVDWARRWKAWKRDWHGQE